MKTLTQKLDLDQHISNFKSFYARDKEITIMGDINQHHRYIKALSTVQFTPIKEMQNLDRELNLLKKQGVLRLQEIYAFATMIGYFNSLKAIGLPEPLGKWIREIDVPDEVSDVLLYFTDEGNINPEREPELYDIDKALKRNKSELKDKESELLSRREEVIYRYCQSFSAIFTKWHLFMRFINREYDRFDHYQARVLFARAYDFNFILPSKKRVVKLGEFCHPAIENPVPVDINLDKSVMLVTGVNAGGKTMLLKSLLSAVYMSKNLLPFKCKAETTEIGHFRSIEAIIDDPQSVKNDISTFAGRMVEFAKLFDKESAIVGVDEIELGTDSDEAASLFRVMLDELRKKGISFIVTTHHKRLASLMASDDEVELIAALYDEERRLPTYTFLQGSIGKSYAFETAQRYGVPVAIVNQAKQVYGEDKENLNELIEKSTSLEREMRLKIAKIDEELKLVEKKRETLEEDEFKLQEQHRKAIATLENRYNAATKKAREALKAKESTEGRRLLNVAHQHKDFKEKELKKIDDEPLKEGDKVKYRSHKGEIVSLRGKDATIIVDGLKMRVPLSQLKRRGDTPQVKLKPKPRKPRAEVNVEKSGASVSVKLLGMYADEAIDTVDKFLSDALVNNLSEVQIIHGTGGGVLSKLVGEYLKNHPKIGKFYRMPGNLGITVVEL